MVQVNINFIFAILGAFVDLICFTKKFLAKMWAQRPELQKMLVFGNTLAILMMGYFSYIQYQEIQ